MKACSKCKQTKQLSEFFKKQSGRASWCKQCLYNYQARRWNRNKTILVKEKGDKCEECGRTGHPAIFDFHHRDPNKKEFQISKIRGASLTKLRKEIEKCELLCSCCHRLRHISDLYWDFKLDPPRQPAKLKPVCACGKICKTGKRFCSPECSAKSNELIKWPSNLPTIVAASSKRAVAASLGVSDKAVAKRLRNHH